MQVSFLIVYDLFGAWTLGFGACGSELPSERFRALRTSRRFYCYDSTILHRFIWGSKLVRRC